MVTKGDIQEVVEKLIDGAYRSSQKQTIKVWNDVCKMLVENNADLTIANCCTQMLNNGAKVSKQTVYNKDGNAYRQIFDLWTNYKMSISVSPKLSSSSTADSVVIDDSDLNKIEDPVTRYQIALLLDQVKSYKKQLDLMQDVRNAQQIHLIGGEKVLSIEESSSVMLDEYELSVLKEFLNASSIEFNKYGKAIAKANLRAGTAISSEGLKQAIQKVLMSYEAL